MEMLLRLEAEAKYFLGATDRSTWDEHAVRGGQLFVNGFRSMWSEWKSG